MNKPPIKFFENFGNYVYMYQKPDGEIYYVGKGKGDRCWNHVNEKGYEPEDCKIIAHNITEDQAFILESYIIIEKSPVDNKVAGHHSEKFIMSNLSGLFDDYKQQQRSMFRELHDFVERYNLTEMGLGYMEAKPSSFNVETGAKNNRYFGIRCYNRTEDNIECYLKNLDEETVERLEKQNPDIVYNKENKRDVKWFVETLDDAIGDWKSFV